MKNVRSGLLLLHFEEMKKTHAHLFESDTDRSDRKVSPQSTVSISAEARKNAEEAVFNREKVEQIKEAIRNNSYPLDDQKMAESFVPLEKLINN